MLAFLQALLSFPTVLIVAVGFIFTIWRIVKFIKRHPGILLGTCQLLQSPSGVFSLLSLFAITMVTLKQPTVGGTAFAAFCAIIPAALGFFEHKEQVLQMQQSVFSPPSPNAAKPNPPSDINSV